MAPARVLNTARPPSGGLCHRHGGAWWFPGEVTWDRQDRAAKVWLWDAGASLWLLCKVVCLRYTEELLVYL